MEDTPATRWQAVEQRISAAAVAAGRNPLDLTTVVVTKFHPASLVRELSEADLPKAQELMDDVTFRRVRHIVTENSRVIATVAALKSSELEKLGQLFEESHASMRDDFEISIPELDLAVGSAD